MDPFGGRMAENVTVCGVSLGGLTKGEADALLRDTWQDIDLSLPVKSLRLTPEESGLKLDTKELLKQAYAIGRSEEGPTELTLAPYLTLDEAAIRTVLEAAAQELSQSYIPSAYFLEGEIPDLSEESFQPEVTPLPTLVVQTGIPAYQLDVDAAWEIIRQSTAAGKFEIDLTEAATPLEAEAPPLFFFKQKTAYDIASCPRGLGDVYKRQPGWTWKRCSPSPAPMVLALTSGS